MTEKVHTSESTNSFDRCKELVVSAVPLYQKQQDLPLIIRCDASSTGIGGYVANAAKDKELPLGYYSCKLSNSQQKWSTVELEAFAIYKTITHFRCLLLGHHFTVYSDHRNLSYLLKKPSVKVERWFLALQEFNYEITYTPGTANVAADALSRITSNN